MDGSNKAGDIEPSGSGSNPARRYFFQCPNIIFDLGLSSRALILYLVIRRTAGDDGLCWRSTRNLAQLAGMSVGSVSKAKRELSRRHWMPDFKALIEIRRERNPHGGKPRDLIRITDIWAANEKYYSALASRSTGAQPLLVDERASSRDELASSAGEIKKVLKEN
jgi:helix-turn-helix protein